ncbi:MFS transporter [Luteimonas sp. SJ-92]|uniref:MFS transporter n=1 Tax=Luteimonas salinisoli TaxID=2752307 RepID=A0A853JF06_9GAMM|nr:MFS transporter [Luteimonas salinisoli]NZA27177.1 MFS transporter [Luteimonas salinisoli]
MLAFAAMVAVTTEFIVVGLLPQMARDLGLPIASAGTLVSGFALAAALFGAPLTLLGARLAPHRVLATVMLCFAAGNLAIAIWPGYPLVLAVRVVEGAGLPVLISVGSAAAARLAAAGQAGRAVAGLYFGVAAAIALAIPAGVLLADCIGWRGSFAALALAAAGAAAWLVTAFPRLQASASGPILAQAAILRQSRFALHLLLSACLTAATFSAYSYLAAWLHVVAGYGSAGIALALMGFGAMGVPGTWIAGRLAERGPVAASLGAALLLVPILAGLTLAGPDPRLLAPLLAAWGMTQAAVLLLCQVRTMLAAPAAPAFAGALNLSACNLGIAAGAIAGGWTITRFGIGALGLTAAALACCAVAVAVLLPFGGSNETARSARHPPGARIHWGGRARTRQLPSQ